MELCQTTVKWRWYHGNVYFIEERNRSTEWNCARLLSGDGTMIMFILFRKGTGVVNGKMSDWLCRDSSIECLFIEERNLS